jgi:hypothetical protein
MTTTTIFGDAVDDYVSNYSATYATARDGAGSFEPLNSAALDMFLGQVHGGGVYYCLEVFLGFDTSGIPDIDVVSAAVLSMYGLNDNDTGDVNNVTVRTYDWGSSVDTGDFRTAAQLNALTSVATAAFGTFTASGYIDFISTGSMPAAINITGFTRFVLHGNRHAAGTAPSNDTEEYWALYSSDNTGTTNDPKLVVTHAAAAVGQPTAKRRGGVQFAGHAPGSYVRRW